MVKFPITSKFHASEKFRDHAHLGVDVGIPRDTELYSIQGGTVSNVLTAEDKSNLGNAIYIKWENGKEAIYGHLNSINVKEGDVVQKGEYIGLSGNTGNVVGENGGEGYHLHFGLKNENGQLINPEPYIPLLQNMGETITKFSDNIQKLDAAEMLRRALEGMSEMPLNFINQLFCDRTILSILHTIFSWII